MSARAAGWAAAVLAAAGIGVAAYASVDAAQAPRDPSRMPPQEAPQRFAFGRAADSARIRSWDIDVRPDGRGLPPGSGTVAQGATVYAQRCASCHGANGEGGVGDRLVSTTPWGEWPSEAAVGNYWPYATTLYDFIVRAMPMDNPGSLSASDTYAVIAWILNKNELVPADAVMNASTLPRVQMPARDRFVPDDRTGGPVIR